MEIVRVLLAGSYRRLNNSIEVAIRDVCYDHCLVQCVTTRRLDEIVHRGCTDEFRLIFVAPDHLVSGPPAHAIRVSLEKVVEAIRTIKRQQGIPIITVGVAPGDEQLFLEAGAEDAFGLLIGRDELRAEIRRVLNLAEPAEEPIAHSDRWSLAAVVLRSFQKLRQAS